LGGHCRAGSLLRSLLGIHRVRKKNTPSTPDKEHPAKPHVPSFQCEPISYVWKQWDGEHEGYCNNFQLAVYINSGLNIFFDLVVFFLPIPKLAQIQVQDKRRKVGVVLTFLVGLFVTACSMVRLKYSTGVSKITNATYEYTEISSWSGIECEVGVICACMPTGT